MTTMRAALIEVTGRLNLTANPKVLEAAYLFPSGSLTRWDVCALSARDSTGRVAQLALAKTTGLLILMIASRDTGFDEVLESITAAIVSVWKLKKLLVFAVIRWSEAFKRYPDSVA